MNTKLESPHLESWKSELQRPIYLDHNATTPCDPRVVAVVSDSLLDRFGNPSSPHAVGQTAKKAVDEARKKIADHIGALPGELIFTSGATESNNIAVLGLARTGRKARVGRYRIITSTIEHKSVLNAAAAASGCVESIEHDVLPVTSDGVVDLHAARKLIDDRTLLVSVQAVNNELGTIQPISELAQIARENGALMHCDAAQALGRIPINVGEWQVHLLSLSAHKAYGPKGVGILYLSGGPANLPVAPITAGGGQEGGLRSGTLNVPGIEGFGEACSILTNEMEQEIERMRMLRKRLERQILSELEDCRVLASSASRVPSTTNIHIAGVEAEALLARLKGVVISTGSACESGAPEPSHVLQAIGLSRHEAYECLRAAVGRFTDEHEVVIAAHEICETAMAIRHT